MIVNLRLLVHDCENVVVIATFSMCVHFYEAYFQILLLVIDIRSIYTCYIVVGMMR